MEELDLQCQKNRDFICPCAKSYFSYAALFTHIKQKHGGKAPGDIIKPKPENKRGRPRKKDRPEQHHQHKTISSNGIIANQNLNNNSKFNYNAAKDYPHIFNSISSSFRSYKEEMEPKELELVRTASDLPLKKQSSDDYHLYRSYSNPSGSKSYKRDIYNGNERALVLFSLLYDLKNNLENSAQQEISEKQMQNISTYEILLNYANLLKESDRQFLNSEALIEILSNFLHFCEEGVELYFYRQALVLLALLLEEIIEENRDLEVYELSLRSLNDSLDQFFANLESKVKKYHLEDNKIFQQQNPVKIMIVFYNWLSISQGIKEEHQKNTHLKHIKSQQIKISIFEEEFAKGRQSASNQGEQQDESEELDESDQYQQEIELMK